MGAELTQLESCIISREATLISTVLIRINKQLRRFLYVTSLLDGTMQKMMHSGKYSSKVEVAIEHVLQTYEIQLWAPQKTTC